MIAVMHFGRNPSSPLRLRPWSLAVVLLALLAMGAQQFAAQTHWHATVAQVEAGVLPAPEPGHSTEDDCLWCHAAAHAASAAPPAVTPRLVLVEEFSLRVLQVRQLVSFPQPAHAWQSRGPPTV
jgi:hypothetical protein